MKLRIIIILMSIACTMTDGFSLTIEQARQLAIDRYPLVRDYNLNALTQEYTLANASKAWLPQIGIGAQATLQSDVASYPEALAQMLQQKDVNVKGIDHFQWKAAVEVNQMIWDGGKVKASKELAKCETAENNYANDVELYQLRQRIDDLFFGILLLDQQAQSIESTIGLLQANVERVQSLVRNGAAMQSDADAIVAEQLSAKQQLQSIKCTREAYQNILALYIGQRAEEELQTPAPLLAPNDNNAANRPETRLLKARQKTLHARLAQIDASLLPHLSAFAQGYYGYPGMNFMQAMLSHKSSVNALAGLSLSWNITPLYTKGNSRALVRAASERIDVAREIFDFNVGVQATKERNELRRLQEISATDAEILQLRQRVRIAAEARLREGIVAPLDLLKSITDEKNASIAADTHRIEYIRATYQLQQILGNQ